MSQFKNFCNSIDLEHLKLIEHYLFSLPSQGNIYTLDILSDQYECCKILVATLQMKLFCIQYLDGKYLVHDCPLPGIPSDADIVSIKGFYSGQNELNIAVAVVLKDQPGLNAVYFYLNWELEEEMGIPMEYSDVKSTSLELSCTPYGLFSTTLMANGDPETVWLLSGGDGVVQMFRRSPGLAAKNSDLVVREEDVARHFPELLRISGIALHIDIKYDADAKSRWTAVSCESGVVLLFRVALNPSGGGEGGRATVTVVETREIRFDFPPSSLKIFDRGTRTSDHSGDLSVEGPLILINTALESSYVFSWRSGSESSCELPESDAFDVVTCCAVADLDYDGANEIVIGTYGQVVLVYKEVPEGSGKWVMALNHPVPAPVLSLKLGDVLADGGNELIVQTMTSLHVYQLDPVTVSSLILERLRGLAPK